MATATNCQPPSLVLGGVEIANAARTLAYIDAGLGPSGLTVGGALADGAYFLDGGASATYTDPASDPAPWYDSDVAESGEFLGFWPSSASGYDGQPLARQPDTRGGYIQGASFNPEQRVGRQHDWTGVLIAATAGGLDYGIRWLAQQLSAECSDCLVYDSVVRLWSPDDAPSWEDGRWREYEVATTVGPIVDRSGGLVCNVAFTVVAGNPYLYKEPLAVLTDSPIATPPGMPGDCLDFPTWWCGIVTSDDVCVAIEPPITGQLAPILVLDATAGGASAIHVLLYDSCPGGSPDSAEMPRGLRVPILPDGWILTIDSSRGVIDAVDPDGNLVNGSNLVESIDGGEPFLSVSDCDNTSCICVGVDKPCAADTLVTATLSVQRRNR